MASASGVATLKLGDSTVKVSVNKRTGMIGFDAWDAGVFESQGCARLELSVDDAYRIMVSLQDAIDKLTG